MLKAFLNLRPLITINSDSSDFEVLTSGRFLIQRPLPAILEPDLHDLPPIAFRDERTRIKCDSYIGTKRWSQGRVRLSSEVALEQGGQHFLIVAGQ